ncbi:hypothetical protein F5Y04DRAFT_274156 [Hypomontagnella monticulosa]|nr:hypothetical protein F5Y04DRAFT_274156 [Hypomontagnella monticulosa]
MSNSATFSYAQAAKGQSAGQSNTTQSNSTQSQAPSTTSTQSRDIAPTPSTRAPSVAVSTSSNEHDGSQNTRSSSVKPESVSMNGNDEDTMSTTDKAAELSSLPSQSTEKVLGEIVPQSTERRGRGQTLTSQTTDASDNKKARKGKKSKTVEKESDQDQDQDKKENVPPKPELSEAPLPAVNIWTQRREAYAAKAKTTPATATQSQNLNGPVANQPNGLTNSHAQIHKRGIAPNDGVDATVAQGRSSSAGVKAPKKDTEQPRSNSNPIPRRAAPRGARMANGEAGRPPFETLGLNANNNSSWPTPETAASGLKVQAQTGKPEKEESGPSKPRQKKEWQIIDFVPSVTFETPIPTRGSRGGRAGGTRGGREASARGNHAVNASTDRTQENGMASGATSVAPSMSKRASIDAAASRDGRKPQAQTGTGKLAGDASTASLKVDSKPTSADQAQVTMSQQAPVRSTSQRTDETKLSQPPRENGTHGAKDSGFQGQNGANRSERTRGNARGRGGHPAMNGVAHPQSQFGQGTAGYSYSTGANVRQPTNPYTNGYAQVPYGGSYPVQTTGNQHRSRPSSGSNRAQGGSRHQSSRASYPVVGVPYDTAVYHNSGPYPAFPDPNHILSGVLSQVEYYFSIDNLCKDWYLRRFMDSQGFVPLGVIATFKRMQEIAQDYQIIRIACDSSPHIEFIVTEAGEDKVRRRDQWEPWVLDMHTRHPSAQHDGPVNYRPFSNQMMAYWPQIPPYAGEGAPMFSPTGTDSHFPLYVNGNGVVPQSVNGVNGHAHPSESQLSATVPEFSPIGNPGMGSSSQQSEVTSDVTGKKIGTSPFGEQTSLPNGSHGPGNTEAITNGVGASHDTEGY